LIDDMTVIWQQRRHPRKGKTTTTGSCEAMTWIVQSCIKDDFSTQATSRWFGLGVIIRCSLFHKNLMTYKITQPLGFTSCHDDISEW
jgi:hypothetical protein